jgi:hypothetical protein
VGNVFAGRAHTGSLVAVISSPTEIDAYIVFLSYKERKRK